MSSLWFALLLVPAIVRSWLIYKYKDSMGEPLTEQELDRANHRAALQTMCGFAFSALLAMIVVDGTVEVEFEVAISFLLVSFLCYLFAMNLQSYKARRWQDLVGDMLVDIASLGLVVAVLAAMRAVSVAASYTWMATFLALAVWLLDFSFRIGIINKFLRTRQEEEADRDRGL